MYKDILYEVDGPAAVVTLKRAPNFAPLQAD